MFEDHNRYNVTGDKKREGSSFSHWDAWGSGRGNRKGDTLQPGEDGEPPSIANQKASAPDVAQADLSGIETTTRGAKKGESGLYSEILYGTVTENEVKPGVSWSSEDGFGLDIASGRAAAGMGAKTGVRGTAEHAGQYGTAAASGDAYAGAELGASAKYGIGHEGIQGDAAASGKAGIGLEGDADLKTKGWQIDGVSEPVDAGIGVHGDAFAGVKAGAGLKAGIGPEYIGAEGKLGAFAGAEAAGDIHGNLGPLAGKLGGSVMAGAGAGLEGGIALENWKLKIGGKMYAALGYGGSFSGEITIDLKQAAELGMAGAKELYEVADADKDNRLTLNDPATHASLAMKGGANLVDKAATGLMGFLDAKKDGKFTKEDITARATQIGDALGDAKDKVVNSIGSMIDKGGSFLDRDKSGSIDAGDIFGHLGDAGTKIAEGAKGLGSDIVETAGAAKDAAIDLGTKAGKGIHNALDFDDDNELTLGDVSAAGSAAWGGMKTAGNAAMQGLKSVGTGLKETAIGAAKGVHDTLDLSGDDKLGLDDVTAGAKMAKGKLEAGAKAAKKAAIATFDKTVAAGQKAYKAAEKGIFDALNRDDDDKLDWNDVKAGAGQLAKGASKAKDTVVSGAKAAWGGAKTAAKAVHGALDFDDDNELTLKDVSAGASKAKDAVVGAGKAVYDEGAAQLKKAADTLGAGYKAASETLSGTWGKVTSFFGW
jgi:hypothetical protein